MHPNPAFRHDDRELFETLISEIGFGMVFASTPDGPRVAHTPLLSTGDGAIQFHLARGNAVTRYLTESSALIVINGPDGYVSPRWYDDSEQVPTWNYVALELEGPVRRMDEDGLNALLHDLSSQHEARVDGGTPWTMDKVPNAKLQKLRSAIVGFEMEVLAWRPTFKLSQNRPTEDRARVADGLEANGSPAIAQLMRMLAP